MNTQGEALPPAAGFSHHGPRGSAGHLTTSVYGASFFGASSLEEVASAELGPLGDVSTKLSSTTRKRISSPVSMYRSCAPSSVSYSHTHTCSASSLGGTQVKATTRPWEELLRTWGPYHSTHPLAKSDHFSWEVTGTAGPAPCARGEAEPGMGLGGAGVHRGQDPDGDHGDPRQAPTGFLTYQSRKEAREQSMSLPHGGNAHGPLLPGSLPRRF